MTGPGPGLTEIKEAVSGLLREAEIQTLATVHAADGSGHA